MRARPMTPATVESASAVRRQTVTTAIRVRMTVVTSHSAARTSTTPRRATTAMRARPMTPATVESASAVHRRIVMTPIRARMTVVTPHSAARTSPTI